MGPVVLSLMASLTLVATAWFTAQPGGRSLTLWIVVGGCICFSFVLFVSEVLLLHALIMGVLLLVWSTTGMPRSLLKCFALVAPLLPYGWAISNLSARYEEVKLARAKYPIVSMAERLAYEPARPVETSGERHVAALSLAPHVEAALVDQERDEEDLDYYARGFDRLHTAYYEEFVASEGFGNQRMRSMYDPRNLGTLQSLENELLPPGQLPDTPGPSDNATSVAPPASATDAPVARAPAPNLGLLESLHRTGAEQFLNPRRFGYVKAREHTVGFQPHRIDRPPVFNRYDKSKSGDWTVAKLELISLLRHPEPRVYVSSRLPRMEELKAAQTRPLDSFEARTLPRLKAAHDIVHEEGANQVRMLGAVRASQSCLQCHNVTRGDLLGAFSYELRRTKMVPEKKTPGGAEL